MWRSIATFFTQAFPTRNPGRTIEPRVRKLAAANPLSVLMMNHLWSHS